MHQRLPRPWDPQYGKLVSRLPNRGSHVFQGSWKSYWYPQIKKSRTIRTCVSVTAPAPKFSNYVSQSCKDQDATWQLVNGTTADCHVAMYGEKEISFRNFAKPRTPHSQEGAYLEPFF